MKMKALLLVLAIIFVMACGVSSEQLTATADAARAQTQTAAPTRTPTRTPTKTPKPTSTATLTPTSTPEPTPAAAGETVQYDGMEITLLKVMTHPQIIVHSYYYYDAKDGYIFIDVIILVRNRKDLNSATEMGDIYVVDKNADAWMPFYGEFRTMELEKSFDPVTMINWGGFSGTEKVIFESKKDTYLRLIWPVLEHQDIILGVEGSPQFTFPVP